MAAAENTSSYMNGLVCWLDAQDKSTMGTVDDLKQTWVGSWRSKTDSSMIYRYLYSVPLNGGPVNIHAGGILTSNEFGKPLISFDYDNWLECSALRSWDTCRTMISVHYWLPRNGSTKSNWYIFSGRDQGPFHCDSHDQIYSGHGAWKGAGGIHFHQGTIRLNGGEAQPVEDLSTWRDGIKIATVQPKDGGIIPNFREKLKRQSRVHRIGRDRVYHEFRGQLGEVMVWDRVLEQSEIEEVELILFKKWFDWSMTLLPDFFEDTTQKIILDYAYGIGKFFLLEKRKLNEEQFREERN